MYIHLYVRAVDILHLCSARDLQIILRKRAYVFFVRVFKSLTPSPPLSHTHSKTEPKLCFVLKADFSPLTIRTTQLSN